MAEKAGHNPYESDTLLAQYLVLHYADASQIFLEAPGPSEAVGFPIRCVTQLIHPSTTGGRALDVGCAVGRSCFELSQLFSEVVGIDFSIGFIHAARQIQKLGSITINIPVEGLRTCKFTASIPLSARPERVVFTQGDAMRLDPSLGTFDLVLAANLICRLPRPRDFLKRLPSLVKPHGQLLLTTPFTWVEEYTSRENWLGNDSKSSFEELCEILSQHFTLELQRDLPFVIREHARKFQYGVATGSRWRRLPSA